MHPKFPGKLPDQHQGLKRAQGLSLVASFLLRVVGAINRGGPVKTKIPAALARWDNSCLIYYINKNCLNGLAPLRLIVLTNNKF
jgi:hypothetical protein